MPVSKKGGGNSTENLRNVFISLSVHLHLGLYLYIKYQAPSLSGSSDILFTRVLGRVARSVGHLTRKSGVLGSIPGLATYFHFFFCFFKKGSCQLLAKVCARSTC